MKTEKIVRERGPTCRFVLAAVIDHSIVLKGVCTHIITEV